MFESVLKWILFFLEHANSQIRYTDSLVDLEYWWRPCSKYNHEPNHNAFVVSKDYGLLLIVLPPHNNF